MKLEVGQFVRTKDGYISQYKYYDTTNVYMEKLLCIPLSNGTFANIEDIVKASYNIIDLIEEGDYLNGFKVSKIERYDTNTIIKIGNSTFNVLEGEKIYTPSYDNNNGYEKIEKLKSIVTKEQFEQMAYKVGD